MYRILVLLAVLFTGFTYSYAQLSQEEVGIVQNLYGMEKRSIYLEVMDLTPSDSVAFWPLYNQFEIDRKDLGAKRIKLMELFVGKYPNISNDEINEIVEESHDIAEELLELEKDYYDMIKDKTSASTAAKFYQIERFLSVAISTQLSLSLPFIGEFSVKNVETDKK